MKRLMVMILLGVLASSSFGAPVPPAYKPDPSSKPRIGVGIGTYSLTVAWIYSEQAMKSGLAPGDQFVRLGTHKFGISDNASDFVNVMNMYRPGATVELEVNRNGDLVIIKIILGEKDDSIYSE